MWCYGTNCHSNSTCYMQEKKIGRNLGIDRETLSRFIATKLSRSIPVFIWIIHRKTNKAPSLSQNQSTAISRTPDRLVHQGACNGSRSKIWFKIVVLLLPHPSTFGILCTKIDTHLYVAFIVLTMLGLSRLFTISPSGGALGTKPAYPGHWRTLEEKKTCLSNCDPPCLYGVQIADFRIKVKPKVARWMINFVFWTGFVVRNIAYWKINTIYMYVCICFNK